MKMSGRVAASAINNREVINGKEEGPALNPAPKSDAFPFLTLESVLPYQCPTAKIGDPLVKPFGNDKIKLWPSKID